MQDSFKNHFKLDGEKIGPAVKEYHEYYADKGIFDNTGIADLLKNLKNAGKTIILETSKAEKYARQILAYFDFVAGAEFDGSQSKKDEVILYALEQIGILSDEEKSRAIMIGDRTHDITGTAKT